jgi:hypothetical protein
LWSKFKESKVGSYVREAYYLALEEAEANQSKEPFKPHMKEPPPPSDEAPEVIQVFADDVAVGDILIETWEGRADMGPHLRTGLVVFVYVAGVGVDQGGVTVFNSRWTHCLLPDNPESTHLGTTVHEGATYYPSGTVVTILRGVQSIPVANLLTADSYPAPVQPS